MGPKNTIKLVKIIFNGFGVLRKTETKEPEDGELTNHKLWRPLLHMVAPSRRARRAAMRQKINSS